MKKFKYFNPYDKIDLHEHRLPHWQQEDVLYSVTWHMSDALPQEKLDQLKEEKRIWLLKHPQPWDVKIEKEYYQKFVQVIDKWLDAGYGSGALKQPELSGIVADTLFHFNEKRYLILSFVIMPNHVHVLFQLLNEHKLDKVLRSWKNYSARYVNLKLGKTGNFWQEDYWDRIIRSEEHLIRCINYIAENPVKAKLSSDEFKYYIDKDLIKEH